MTNKRLQGKVAMVTGASRGGGRGIAMVLGEEGATVYVTGRSARGGQTTDGRRETVEETAEMVTARGGVGIAVRCDHTRDEEVQAAFERVRKEQGRLDILANCVFGGSEDGLKDWGRPFWERHPGNWEGMFGAGVRAYLMAARYVAPLMLPNRRGLIINLTFWDHDKKLDSIYYDLAMNANNRMAFDLAAELKEHDIAAVALVPGWMRTERVMDGHFSPEEMAGTESVEYVGRAAAALAADPEVMKKTGQVLYVGDLAKEYGFTDTDGRWIPPYRLK
ncbi:MAG: SDR family NAD(P)-dependent oxidoreductase [Bacillota bacterium]